MKSRFFLLAIFIVLIISYNLAPVFFPVTSQGQQPIQFQAVYIIPTQPREGETIYVQARVFSTITLKNVSLYWSVNEGLAWNISDMVLEGVNTYKGVIPPQQARTNITYYLEAYDLSNNYARWPSTGYAKITVIGIGEYMNISLNKSMALKKGLNYLNITDAKVSMKLNLSASLNLTVRSADVSSLNSTFSKIIIYSNSISFSVNNSDAIINAVLEFGLTKKISKNDDVSLVAYWRENNDSLWKTMEVEISENKNTATVYTTHLSEWVVGGAEPQLELTVFPEELDVRVGEEFNINTTVSNIGGGLLLNISLMTYYVEDIICTSGFDNAFLTQLSSKESKSLVWGFKAKNPGDYNIVFVATSGDQESATFTVKVHVGEFSESTSNSSLNTVFLPFFFAYSSLFFMAALLTVKKIYRMKSY